MDSIGKIVDCIQDSAKFLDLPVPNRHDAKQIIGMSLVPALQTLFNLDSLQEAERLAKRYKQYYAAHPLTNIPLFDGAKPLICHLKDAGYRLAIATGKGRTGLVNAMTTSEMTDYFETYRCADDAKSKPSPDMLEQILQELGVKPEQALMVGDTSFDMQMAQSLGMDRVGVTFGVHDQSVLEQYQPIAIIDRLEQLLEHL